MLFLLSLEKKKERRGKIVHILRRLRAILLVRVKIIKLRHVDYPEINSFERPCDKAFSSSQKPLRLRVTLEVDVTRF